MSINRRKTVLRSIRFTAKEAEILSKEAESKGISFNALVSGLITHYIEWDRFAERYGFVALGKQSFRNLISSMTEEQLEKWGKETGSKHATDMALFWFKRLDLQAFLSLLAVCAKYMNLWHYEVEQQGRNYVVTVHNDIGPALSASHRIYFDQVVRSMVGVTPKVEVRGNSVVITFTDPGAERTKSSLQ